MRKATLILLSLLFGVPVFVNAQEVEWQSKEYIPNKVNGFPYSYPVDAQNHFSITRNLRGNTTLTHYSNFISNASVEIELKVNGNKGHYAGAMVIGGQMTLFITVEDGDNRKLYSKRFDASCQPTEEGILLDEYKSPTQYYYQIIQSANKEFFAIDYSYIDEKTKTLSTGYKVFEDNFEMLSGGIHSTSYSYLQTEISAQHLSNKGEFYRVVSVYELTGSGKTTTRAKQISCWVGRCDNEDVDEIDLYDSRLDVDNQLVADLVLNADLSDALICTGFYGENGKGGLFYATIDLYKNEVIADSYYHFEMYYVNTEWLNLERISLPGNSRHSRWMKFIDLFAGEDGSTYVVAEEQEEYYSGSGSTIEHNHEFHNVFVYKISTDGNIAWVQRINKTQNGVEARVSLGGISGYRTNNQYVMFFNDNIRSYDQSNVYTNEGKYSSTAIWTNKDNCVAQAKVDLTDGQILRSRVKVSDDPKEDKIYLLPTACEANYQTNQFMISILSKSGERIGLMKF